MRTASPAALRLMAGRLDAAAWDQRLAARRLTRTAARLQPEWRGQAADAAVAVLDRLDGEAGALADAHDEAALVLQQCAVRLEEARATSDRAEALRRQDADDRAAATARGQFVPPYASPLARQADRLAAEAQAAADEACRAAAAALRDLADAAPHSVPRGLSTGDQVRAVGPAAVDALWGSVTTMAGLSLPRLLVDADGWLAQVRGVRDGIAYAADEPGEALEAVVGWDLLEDGRYGEWVGSALPDAVSGLFSGGAVPVARRTAGMAEELADLAEDVDDLQRVTRRRVDAGGPVHPRPGVALAGGYVSHVRDLAPDRRTHILDGDPPEVRGGRGGGHRHGTGKRNKTEFPASWTDDDIIRRVMETARRPEAGAWQPEKRTFRVTAEHEGVTVVVIVDRQGSVITAYPRSGPGVVRNR